MRWKNFVIDASMDCRGGLFTFCPIEGDLDSGDYVIITGMNFLGSMPQGGNLVAIVHPDGQVAVERFCDENKEALDALKGTI